MNITAQIMRPCVLTFMLTAAACCGWANAQPTSNQPVSIYTCKDASGRTLTSDRPIPECNDRAMRVLGASGVQRREIEAPPTREQLQARKLDEEKRQQAAETKRLQDARDKALVLTYTSVEALESTRKRQIGEVERDIEISEQRLKAARAELWQAQSNLSANKEPPAQAKRKIDDLNRVIRSDEQRLNKLQADAKRINDRFDTDGARLRELFQEPAGASVRKVSNNDTAGSR